MLTDAEIVKILTEMKVPIEKVNAALAQLFKRGTSKTTPQVAPRVKTIIEKIFTHLTQIGGVELIAPEHLLLALFEEGEGIGARLLAKSGVQGEDS